MKKLSLSEFFLLLFFFTSTHITDISRILRDPDHSLSFQYWLLFDSKPPTKHLNIYMDSVVLMFGLAFVHDVFCSKGPEHGKTSYTIANSIVATSLKILSTTNAHCRI